MTAGILNFDNHQTDACYQGADFDLKFTWTQDDDTVIALSNYTMKMQIRKNFGEALIIELSTINGRITVDSNEEVTVALNSEETSSLLPGIYLYDLMVTDQSNKTTKLLEGRFEVIASITI